MVLPDDDSIFRDKRVWQMSKIFVTLFLSLITPFNGLYFIFGVFAIYSLTTWVSMNKADVPIRNQVFEFRQMFRSGVSCTISYFFVNALLM